MKLPVELKRTLHKHGGKIERIYSVEHACAKPEYGHSRDTWFFIGDVTWNDGGKSDKIELAPFVLCAEEGANEPELTDLFALMNEHLLEHGDWYREGKHQGWYANVRPEARVRRRA